MVALEPAHVRRPSAALAVIFTLAACEAAPVCVDRDLDGLGAGCEGGPDCDDTNPDRGPDCDAVPPPDCETDPRRTGCPCLPGSVSECFPGPAERAGIGLCTTGRSRCVNGHWGRCVGAQAPRAEICDGLDQDCDGAVDEGVRSPCGGCTRGCDGDVWGDPFVEGGPGLAIGDRGELTLARIEAARGTVWVPNTAEGTVSRIDAARAVEVARYATGDRDAIALEPSRVGVDWNGDAWIANRAFDDVSSVVRIAGDPERCVDRDGDGVETSSGPDDVRAWGEDECVVASVAVGAAREVARALAIDGDRGLDGAGGGDVWIGLHDGQAFVEVDGATARVRRRIETPGFSPYAAVFDPWGRLWSIAREGHLLRIDPGTDPPELELIEVPLGCWLLYGLAVDAQGRLAMTGFSCDTVTVYDPRLARFSTVPTAPSPRGAAFEGTTLWVAHTAGRVSRMALDPLRTIASTSIATSAAAPLDTIGVGTDGLGSVWVISSRGAPDGAGVATRIDGERGVVTAQVPVGAAPHTHGDPIGVARFGEFVPEGSASRVFLGCPEGGTRWVAVHAAIDPGTHGAVRLEVRHAADAASLAVAPFEPLGTVPEDPLPFPLALPEGGVVEIRLTLSVRARIGAPRVQRIGVQWVCPGPV
jgi:streptogramin lyase